MPPFPTGCGPPFCWGPTSCLFDLLEVFGLGTGGTATGFLLVRGLGGTGLSLDLLLTSGTTPFLGVATWSGEVEGDVNTSGIETLPPVAGAATVGSTTLLSITELVRESYLSFTEVRDGRLQVT